MARLEPAQARFLAEARSAVLATTDSTGRPRLVPICHVLIGTTSEAWLYTPLDDKPKRVADVHDLGRVRDLLARPEATVLVDRWDEDWGRLAWLRIAGAARLLEPDDHALAAERAAAIAALRAKYPQYAGHDLESRPLIRIDLGRVVGWGALGETEPGEPG